MGALHAGHASLIRRARRENDRVVVSIFVNPAQFGPNEDFNRYPRAFAADRKLCAGCGADAIYHPSVAQVYPEGFGTFVEPPASLANVLEGEFRPGHFRGVATVVLKLLETVRPARAYFGEKDWQQLAVVRRMAADLDLDAKIIGCPTIRDADGLALSSRNAYLSAEERAAAPRIHEALKLGDARAAAARIRAALPGARIDYVRLVDAVTLVPRGPKTRALRLLAAVRVGRTRLIDNVPVSNRSQAVDG
jgi:pantoate--beta-alanine ligase